MVKSGKRPHGKMIVLGYDALIDNPADSSECPYCLTVPQVQAMLAFAEYMFWPTRWESLSGIDMRSDAVQTNIREFAEDLRRRLMSCCCDQPLLPVLHRVDPATGGDLQVSYDNGVTWIPDPQSPALTVTQLPPPVPAGVSSNRCDAATNGKQHLDDAIAGASAALETATTIAEFMSALILLFLAAFFAPAAVPILIPILIAAANACFVLGKTAFDAYWTTTEHDKILCALFCFIGEDGHFTDTGFQGVLSKLGTDLTAGPPKDWFIAHIKALGVNGLNNLCSYGNAADADCSSCDCPRCPLDLLLNVNCPTAGMTIVEGSCVSGQGIEADFPHPPFGDLFLLVEYVFSEPCDAAYMHIKLNFASDGIENHAGNQWWIDHAYTRDEGGALVWVDGSGAQFNGVHGVSTTNIVFTPAIGGQPSLAWRMHGWNGGYQGLDNSHAYLVEVHLNDSPT